MKPLDRFIQRGRFRAVARHIPNGARILDVGSHEGELFDWLGDRIEPSVGVEVNQDGDRDHGPHHILAGEYPARRPSSPPYGAATLLAVVEHLDDDEVVATSQALVSDLEPGAPVIVTVPSPIVDRILAVLIKLRILDGMEADQHHGFEVEGLEAAWKAAGLRLVEHRRFQLFLNNLFVFEAPR